jgi:hypothetical protein
MVLASIVVAGAVVAQDWRAVQPRAAAGPPQYVRATLEAYFVPVRIMELAGYALVGLWMPAVTWYLNGHYRGLIIATVAGRFINHRMQGDGFLRTVYGFGGHRRGAHLTRNEEVAMRVMVMSRCMSPCLATAAPSFGSEGYPDRGKFPRQFF